MGIAEKLQIVITAQDQTAVAFRAVSRGIASINADLLAMKAGLLGIVGTVGFQRMYSSVRSAVANLDDLGDAAERIGMSTDALQTFRFQLGQFGGDAAQAETALDRFSNKIGEAARGSGFLVDLFKANGVALRGTNGEMRAAEDLLQDFARLVANAGSAQEKINLATEAFGRAAGPKMVGLLQEIDRVGFQRLITDARDADQLIGADVFGAAGDLEKQFQRLEGSMEQALKILAVEAGPAAIEVLQTIVGLVRSLTYSWELLKGGRKSEVFNPDGFEIGKRALVTGFYGSNRRYSLGDASDIYDALGFPAPAKVTVTGRQKTNIPGAGGGGERKDDFERQVDAIAKHIAMMEADAKAVGATAGEHERLRTEAQLLEAAQRSGIVIDEKRAASMAALAERAKVAADRMAAFKELDQILFERGQIGRSEDEQKIYSQLRGAGISPTSDAGKFLAEQIRLNDVLKDGKDIALDFAKSLRDAFKDGKVTAQEWADMLDAILNKLSNKALDAAISGLFSPGAASGGNLFAALGSLISPGGGAQGFSLTSASGLYDSGGYTGRGPRRQVAGVVHAGEFVFSAPAVDRIGVGRLDALHRGLRGYAEGGHVGGAPSSRAGRNDGPNVAINVANYGSDQVDVDSRKGGDGSTMIDIAIGRSLASGRQDGALGARFGARPRLINR